MGPWLWGGVLLETRQTSPRRALYIVQTELGKLPPLECSEFWMFSVPASKALQVKIRTIHLSFWKLTSNVCGQEAGADSSMKMFTWFRQPLAKRLSMIRLFFAAAWTAERKDWGEDLLAHTWNGEALVNTQKELDEHSVPRLSRQLYWLSNYTCKWLSQIRAQGSLGEFLDHHKSFPIIVDEKSNMPTRHPWKQGLLPHTTLQGVLGLSCCA